MTRGMIIKWSDEETGRTYFEATGKEYKTIILF